MLKPSPYLILATFLITLESYRIPTPLGLTITTYHILFGLALYLGGLAFLSRTFKINIDKETRVLLTIFIIFAFYSLLSFLINISKMKAESISVYYSELIGYCIVFSLSLLIRTRSELQKTLKAFLASAVFVYLGVFWHSYNFVAYGQYITGTPFWHEYTISEHVFRYLEDVKRFEGFPRFRLPFSSPAGAGVFLSLAGILLLVFTIHYIASKKRGAWLLVLLNLLNLFGLLGTFARASWAVYAVGSLFTLWYLRKFNLISFGKRILIPLVLAGFFFAYASLTGIFDELYHIIGLRFNPEINWMSNIGHMESRMLAFKYWIGSPILGLGVGGFFTKPEGGIHTHCTYLTLLVERGLIGLMLFLGFLFQLFRTLNIKIRLSLESNDKIMLTYNIGFLGSLAGLFIGMFLYDMISEVFWLFLGMILTCGKMSSKRSILRPL